MRKKAAVSSLRHRPRVSGGDGGVRPLLVFTQQLQVEGAHDVQSGASIDGPRLPTRSGATTGGSAILSPLQGASDDKARCI